MHQSWRARLQGSPKGFRSLSWPSPRSGTPQQDGKRPQDWIRPALCLPGSSSTPTAAPHPASGLTHWLFPAGPRPGWPPPAGPPARPSNPHSAPQPCPNLGATSHLNLGHWPQPQKPLVSLPFFSHRAPNPRLGTCKHLWAPSGMPAAPSQGTLDPGLGSKELLTWWAQWGPLSEAVSLTSLQSHFLPSSSH